MNRLLASLVTLMLLAAALPGNGASADAAPAATPAARRILSGSQAPAALAPPRTQDAPASAITAGSEHTCALTGAGGVMCWGRNDSGQLGDGTTINRLVPVDVVSLSGGVAAITAGESHTCALMTSGTVKCWGNNAYGQLGDGTTTTQLMPVDANNLPGKVTAISAGGGHTCALTDTGGVKCWGKNSSGELGDGMNQDQQLPVDVVGLTSGVAYVAAGGHHTCAALDTSKANVKCWGSNASGQLGDGTVLDHWAPVDVKDIYPGVDPSDPLYPHVKGLAAGGSDSFALLCGGFHCSLISAWGDNAYGQLGDGTTISRTLPEIGAEYVYKVAAAATHTCMHASLSPAACWGDNRFGQLGDGTTVQHLMPVNVFGAFTPVSDVATGLRHSCALLPDSIQCWGDNAYGQLGDGTTIMRTAPVAVVGFGAIRIYIPLLQH